MFCRYCGQDNDEHSIYCGNDGVVLHSGVRNINLRRDNTRFCKDCGQAIKSYDIYCSKCGNSLYEKIKKSKAIEIPIVKDAKVFKGTSNISGSFDIKGSLIQAAIGLGIVLLISLIIASGINGVIQEELSYEFGLPMEFKVTNFLDVGLLINVVNLKFGMVSEYSHMASATFSGAPFLFILIPFLVFFALGIYRGRKNNKMNQSINLKDIALIGLSYGLVLSLLSLIASSDKSMYIPYLGEQITFQKNYLIFTALLNGTLISTISLLLGYGAYWKFSKNDDLIGNFAWLFNALFIFLTGALLVSLATGVYLKLALKESMFDSFADFMMFVQRGIYSFLMINLGTFNLFQDFSGQTMSLFKNIDAIKYDFGNGSLIFLYILILLPIFLFYMHGKKVKQNGNGNIIYTSLAYALLVGVLAYLTYGKLTGTGGGGFFDDVFSTSASIGFKFIYSIIGSFVLAILSSLAGFFLSKEDKREVFNH